MPSLDEASDEIGYNVAFTYSFSLSQNGETEYYSGKYSRIFRDADRGRAWHNALKAQKIPVRYDRGNPDRSTVLSADLESRFPLPSASSLSVPGASAGYIPRLPQFLRWPTHALASLLAIGFCIVTAASVYWTFLNDFFHPAFEIGSWVTIFALVIPYNVWFSRKTAALDVAAVSSNTRGPLWLRISATVAYLYFGGFFIFEAVVAIPILHLHWDHLHMDPFSNGTLVACYYANTALRLYRRLGKIEDPSNPAAYGLQPE